MFGTARHREQDMRTLLSGDYFNVSLVPQTVTLTGLSGVWGFIDDMVGNLSIDKTERLDNALTIVRNTRRLPTLTGSKVQNGVVIRRFSAAPIGLQANPLSPAVPFPLSEVDKSNYGWSIAAKTNPNNAHVSMPTFIGELRDVPSLIKGWGGSVIAQMAKGHLTWRWGLKPMISDVKKMLRFVEAVDHRVRQLKTLRDGGYLRQRCGLGDSSYWEPPTLVNIHSQGALLQAYRSTTYTCKVWGTSRWKLRSDTVLPPASSSEERKLAWSLVTGMTSYESVATTWELLPWSWFADWFVGVGTMVQAANNTISTQWSNMCLMRTLSSKTIYVNKTPAAFDAWAAISGQLETECIRKERYAGILPGTAGPPTNLLGPLLGAKNWSILGSLWVLNSKNASSIRRAKTF